MMEVAPRTDSARFALNGGIYANAFMALDGSDALIVGSDAEAEAEVVVAELASKLGATYEKNIEE